MRSLLFIFSSVFLYAQQHIPVPVLTPCELLRDADALDGQLVIVVGRYLTTGEDTSLSQDCASPKPEKINDPQLGWYVAVELYTRSTPLPPVTWDMDAVKIKLAEVKRSTKLKSPLYAQQGRPKPPWDAWVVIYGRITSKLIDPRYGFGHLSSARAQIEVGESRYLDIDGTPLR